MKPCSSKRKLIVCLALDILDESKRNRLRAHLSACEGCRSYLRSISNVTEKLGATKPGLELEPSQSFHRELVKRLEADRSLSFSKVLGAAVGMMRWRYPGVALAALACIGAITWVLLRQQDAPKVPRTGVQIVEHSRFQSGKNLLPTVSNYQIVANRSLERLDELLTLQGNVKINSSETYTASILSKKNLAD